MEKEDISAEEKGILGVVRLNKVLPRVEIKKSVQVGRLKITFNWRSKKNFWGRFGGGWNWILGFEVGGNTIIFNLLICSVRLDWKRGQ